MKRNHLKLVVFVFVFFMSTTLSVAQTFCPSITAFTSTTPLCAGSCAVLNASVIPVNQTTSYSVQSIPYTPFPYTGGTGVSVGTDDVWSPVINLGFNFCYFGNIYSQCLLGSNGQLTFSVTPPLPSGYDNWSITTAIPSTNDMPGNTICAAFRDIDPSFGGNMRYYFSGVSPCRALVIYWDNIPLYDNPGPCSGKPNSTFQLVLYENTNFIDVYVQNSTSCSGWNGGKGIIGIQNAAATVAYSPPSRNFPTAWTATNEGWRFVPTGPQSYTVTWSGPSGIIGTGLTQSVCPSSTTTYTASMNVTSCSGVNSTYTSAVTVTVSPNPPPVITSSVTQTGCSSSTNAANVSLSSGTPGYTVNWSPSATFSGSTATTYSVTGLSAGVNTVSVIDAFGCTATQTLSIAGAPQVPTLNIVASNLVVGCAPPTVTIGVVNTNTALTNMTYTWSSITTTGTAVAPDGSIIDVGAPSGTNTLIVTGSDPSSGCTATASCVLTASTSAPSFTISPVLTQSIGCSQPCKTFTAVATTTTNVFGTWYDVTGSPAVPLVGPSGGTVVLCAGTPGTYAMTFTNMVTGCTTTQTVSVTSNTSVPTITVTSVLGGFQLNCTKPCLPLNINSNVVTGPTSYTWTNLTTNVSTSPPSGGFTVCTTGANVPGQYVASVKDGLGCTVSTTITISIDTLKPAPTSTASLSSLAPDSYTINCFTPSIVATGITNPMYPVSNYSWTIPGTPNLIISSQTVTVSMVNIPSSTSPTNYTVLAMNPNNGCVGRKLVKFYKDIFVPPYTTVYTPSAITCDNPCVAFSPKNSVTSNTMPITYTFTSPPPTQTATTLGALMCVPGPYTMTYMNALNGCTAQATTTVQLNTTPPATFALAPVHINCGATTATLIAGHTGSATNTYSYTWKPPTNLAGMSCPGGVGCYSTTTNMAGQYFVSITNTVNGCQATNSVMVLDNGGILSGVTFTANPSTGFSPLDVNFDNTTILTNTSTGVVSTTWNYGNGISMTYTGSSGTYSLTGPDGSSTYQSAGNYTVYLIISQVTGTNTCVGTATAVISVDLPSKIDVPNVFTPNADGVNDVFMLQTTNLTEITCTIFDRWGVKMYDVKADKGNIEWDGKNFSNKDVPAGTYFYVLKAKGKDAKDYEQKGTISLYR